MIYFDNASTSFPKPFEVVNQIQKYLLEFGVSPGRGAYGLAEQAEELVNEARRQLTQLIGGEKESHLIFTNNATHSLNLIIKGFLKKGDHVLICSYSHNSVIRPIDTLARAGLITYDVFEVDENGWIDLSHFCSLIKSNTRLVIGNHASNVIGVISSSLLDIARLCNEKGIRFLLDSTQSLGYAPINMSQMPIDFLAGTGHKTLFGPSGVGFLYVKNPKELTTIIEGGSGGNHSTSPFHPTLMPYKLEAGTLNTTCIAGLKGAMDYIEKTTYKKISSKSMHLAQMCWNLLSELDEILLYGTEDFKKKIPVISYNILNALPTEISHLYSSEGICLRAGIQCAPLIHKTIQTLPTGTLRISLGHYNQEEEVYKFIDITKKILASSNYAKKSA